jgi:hypothetical protein
LITLMLLTRRFAAAASDAYCHDACHAAMPLPRLLPLRRRDEQHAARFRRSENAMVHGPRAPKH